MPVDPDAVRTRIRGALLGTMVGDAAGAPFEGQESGPLTRLLPQGALPAEVSGIVAARQRLSSFVERSESLRYTDDTEMMIALAESLIAERQVEPDRLVAHFAARFHPERGYGRGTLDVLTRVRDGGDWRTAVRQTFEDGSAGSGAAMRVAPVAAFYHDRPDAATQAARDSASVTHAHDYGIAGAVLQTHAIGIALFAGLHRQPIRPEYFLRALAGRAVAHGLDFDVMGPLNAVAQVVLRNEPVEALARAVGNGLFALESVPAALGVFLLARGEFEESVALAIELGGDTDTIAAMAGATAGAYWGEEEIPRAMLDRLADEDVTPDGVRVLADSLCDLWLGNGSPSPVHAD